MNKHGRPGRLLALTAALGLVLAACSSGGGAQEEEKAESLTAGGSADTPKLNIAMVTHQAPGDTFWDIVREGAEAAAAKDNVDLEYTNDDQAPGQANLVQAAVDEGVDGIALTLAKPQAMKGVLQNAQEAGIPVVALNAGMGEFEGQPFEPLMFFGQDEYIAGQAAGERLSDDGAKHVLCVIQEQGHVGLEDRCGGVKETFTGKTETIYVQGTSMPTVLSDLTAKLQQSPSIDRVLTLGAPFALTAVDAVDDAGSSAEVVTFDTNEELVGAIESGDVQWAVDQQPFLQGYMAVDSLWFYLTNGNILGGEDPVLTGPSFIDKTNIDTVAEYAERGTR